MNRLSRQLTAALLGQHENGASSSTPGRAASLSDPSVETMLESLRRENEQLRNRLVDTERDFIRVSRLNDIYREELIEHRMRVSDCLFCCTNPVSEFLTSSSWVYPLTTS